MLLGGKFFFFFCVCVVVIVVVVVVVVVVAVGRHIYKAPVGTTRISLERRNTKPPLTVGCFGGWLYSHRC